MISVVIPVLNNYEMTDHLLLDIANNTVVPLEIILIDNNSLEPIYNLVKKYQNLNILYIRNPQNTGVNAAWNLGRYLAKGKYITILNNDIRVSVDFFKKIIDSMEGDDRVGLCSVRISKDLNKIFEVKDPVSKKYVFEMSGSAYTLRKTISDEIGPIPKELFIFYGDNFILSRLSQLGYKAIVISNNDIFHYDHYTINKFAEKKEEIFNIYYNEQDIFTEIIKQFKFDHYVWNLENHNQKMIDWQDEKGEVMIYDIFPFMNEFDILEIRLNELYDVVDKFVIFECDKTFTNLDKPLYLKENLNRFSKFLDKIILLKVDKPEENNPWLVYNIQIDQVVNKLRTILQDDDIIIISDVDEIPRKGLFNKYTKPVFVNNLKNTFYQVQQRMSYHKYNCLADHDWYGSVILNKSAVTQYPPHKFREWRESTYGIKIFNGGWHFSYIQTPEEIQLKIKSFAHQEYNKEEYTNLNRIKKCIDEGYYLFDWNRKLEFVKFEDLDFPKYLEQNKEKFSNFIKEV